MPLRLIFVRCFRLVRLLFRLVRLLFRLVRLLFRLVRLLFRRRVFFFRRLVGCVCFLGVWVLRLLGGGWGRVGF